MTDTHIQANIHIRMQNKPSAMEYNMEKQFFSGSVTQKPDYSTSDPQNLKITIGEIWNKPMAGHFKRVNYDKNRFKIEIINFSKCI